MDNAFIRMTGGAEAKRTNIKVKGREVVIPSSAQGVARFEFTDLCAANLGAVDYLELARTFHTIFIDNIPCSLT
jgi:cell division protein ZapE